VEVGAAAADLHRPSWAGRLANLANEGRPVPIPRVIHQIWVGPKARPTHWMDGWRLPGWDYRLWREPDLANLHMVNRPIFELYVKHGCWHGASDVARVEILAEQGGVFMDADMECLQPLDEAPWLNSDMFAGQSPDDGQVVNGIMGCRPGAPLMLAYRDAIGNGLRATPLRGYRMYPVDRRIGPTLMTKLASRYPVEVIPPGAFFDEGQAGERYSYEGTVYGRHHWMTTRQAIAGERVMHSPQSTAFKESRIGDLVRRVKRLMG
jgi:mannosyltransferase OCH1-like enzyme